MALRPVVLDFETFFSDEFTLKKMSTESYIRDARFIAHGASVKWTPSSAAVWYDEKELRWQLAQEDWSDVFLICHHNQFDGLILSHHYDVHPAMMGCTMSMARAFLGNHIGVSLDSVRSEFGIPAKRTPYHLFRGKHWHEMTRDVQELIAEGANDEVESIWKIFQMLMTNNHYPFPAEELEVIDTTIKMFTEPCMTADIPLLRKVWGDEAIRKQGLLAKLNIDEKRLASSDEFAALLRERGVEPDMKPGKPLPDGTPKNIYAFAKDDPFMEELLVDEDEEIRALAEARLGIKSTLLQTRAETVGRMAERGPVCVYLKYFAAHTSRWGGGDRSNFQNWTNGSEINSALIAPNGYLIAEPDASQIECRLLNFCAGQWDKIEEFRSGGDPYIGVASAFYGFPVNKKDHPDERQLGKIVELQAGYGSGGGKIAHTVRIKSKGKIQLDDAGGMKARDAYRGTHLAISNRNDGYWAQAEAVLGKMHSWMSFDWGPFRIRCDVERGTKRIVLPNDIQLNYDTLQWHVAENGDKYWRLKTRKGWAKLYGAKLIENIIQALARVVVSQAMIRLKHRGYHRCACTKHDSLWLIIPKDDRLEEHKAIILEEMSRTPSWLPGIPLAAEFKTIGERYA